MFNTYGIKVKKRLIELDMSQKELAEKVGISTPNLNEILKGKRKGWKHRDKIDFVLENEPSRWFERESDI